MKEAKPKPKVKKTRMAKPLKGRRGGPRPGAGRPLLEGEPLTATLRVRMTPKLHERCLHEGSSYVRHLLERHFEELGEPNPLAEARKDALQDLAAVGIEAANRPIDRWDARAACGFPSPALETAGEKLNLSEYFVPHADSFAIEASGDSMVDAGIFEGDLVFVDRTREARPGDIVLAFLDGSYTIKELQMKDGLPELHPKNELANYPVLRPKSLDDFFIEGVVVSLGRRLKN